ncbi:diguanylate cyclase [Methylomonas sp. SURF-1]|uniref:diguanylate cyclase n=1 Tax=Methylomonas aurea TaxID=2952224 RepID=A0ABT1UEC9_9GAMM|nr:diguanylate cyclase [Methylomonas sp. SURF-1]MCQ8180583.1 diguanylate cyclase [Methylomonas sp. SURF-1]
MSDSVVPTIETLQAEVLRLNKVVEALMNRDERGTDRHASAFDQFQSTVMLEELVRARTRELESALIENQAINRALREAEQKFHRVLDQSLVGITMTVDGRFQYVNPKFAEILGYTQEEMQRLGPAEITAETDRQFLNDVIVRSLAGEFKQITFTVRARRKNGEEISVEISGNEPIDIGGRPALIAVWADVTERLRAEREILALQEKLREQAFRDPLTGLYNRLFLDECLEREFARCGRTGCSLSMVIADLDFFKSVNDRYGHQAGDAALRHMAAVLSGHARASDIVCRFGGEEFLLLLPDTAASVAWQRAEDLRAALERQPVVWQAERIGITASFGVSSYPADAATQFDLIAAADTALYAAKAGGRNRVGGSARVDSASSYAGAPPASTGRRQPGSIN